MRRTGLEDRSTRPANRRRRPPSDPPSDFTTRAPALQPDAPHDQILATLGPATEEDGTLMEYDLAGLKGFPGIPGPPNTETFVELHIMMSAGRATAIDFASIPGAAPKPIPQD